MDVDLCLRPATELAQLVRSRQLSIRELLSIHLAQIERLNPLVNAICTLNVEEAVTIADDLDKQLSTASKSLGELRHTRTNVMETKMRNISSLETTDPPELLDSEGYTIELNGNEEE